MITIRNWNETFEFSESRKRKTLEWFAAPAGNDSRGYRRLMREGARGREALGVFVALCQLMATLPIDTRKTGTFLHSNGDPMDVEDLLDLCRLAGMEPGDFREIMILLEEIEWTGSEPEDWKQTVIALKEGLNDAQDQNLPASSQSLPKSSRTHNSTRQDIRAKALDQNRSDLDRGLEFNSFWKAYPRKVGKKKALEAWKRHAKHRPPLDKILDAISAWKKSPEWTKDGGNFIPHPTTWINRAGWDDEIEIDTKRLVKVDTLKQQKKADLQLLWKRYKGIQEDLRKIPSDATGKDLERRSELSQQLSQIDDRIGELEEELKAA